MISGMIGPPGAARNVALYPWFRFCRGLLFWQAVWFLYFQNASPWQNLNQGYSAMLRSRSAGPAAPAMGKLSVRRRGARQGFWRDHTGPACRFQIPRTAPPGNPHRKRVARFPENASAEGSQRHIPALAAPLQPCL